MAKMLTRRGLCLRNMGSSFGLLEGPDAVAFAASSAPSANIVIAYFTYFAFLVLSHAYFFSCHFLLFSNFSHLLYVDKSLSLI